MGKDSAGEGQLETEIIALIEREGDRIGAEELTAVGSKACGVIEGELLEPFDLLDYSTD